MDEHTSTDARLSNYRVERLLGAGGMGSVYLARDLTLDRLVAIKFIAPERAGNAVARRRLIREARAAAALEHPHICGVYEVIDATDGRACIVMQYIEGETLAQKLRGGPMDVRLAMSICADLASALVAAHKRGIVHRDLKPQNVMVTADNRARLLDFGLARQSDAVMLSGEATTATELTGQDVIVGTPAYMSPEQARQLPLDGRSDLFALGAVLFECLTGRRAFEGNSGIEQMSHVLHHEPPPVSSLRPELTVQHDELVRRLLAKHADDRFRSADEALGALRVLLPDSGRSHGAAGSQSTSGSVATRLRRLSVGGRPAVAAGAAVLALLVISVLAFTALPWVSRKTEPSYAEAIVGVLPFTAPRGSASDSAASAGLEEAVTSRLRSTGLVRVLPLEETREAVAERADAAGAARTLGATFVVEGAVVPSPGGLAVDVALVAPDGERRPAGRYAHGGNLLDLHRRMAEGLLKALAQAGAVSAADADAVPPPTENAAAFAEYAQARTFLERPDVQGNLDHAIRLFQRAVATDPHFALAHAGLAEAYWAQFQETKDPAWTRKALQANLDALQVDPTLAEVRMSLAVMYNGQGRHDEAIQELQHVMQRQPGNDNAHRLLASIHAARSDWTAAISAAQRAVALRPSYWRNHSQLGLAYFRAGRYDEAAAAYRRVVELQPDSARGYQMLGTVLHSAGKNDEALPIYEKSIRIRPSPGTLSNLGTLYFWKGEHQKAAETYERALALSPNDPLLHANLGDAYAGLGQSQKARQAYTRAVQHVEQLLSVSPNDAQHLASLALYQAKLGRRGPAAEAIQRALSENSKDGQVLYAAALVHALARNNEAACANLTGAIEHGASTEEIRHAGELQALTGCPAYDQINADRRRD